MDSSNNLWIVHCTLSYLEVSSYNFLKKGTFLSNDLLHLTNSVDPDEILHYAAFHLGLCYLQKQQFRDFRYTKGYQ